MNVIPKNITAKTNDELGFIIESHCHGKRVQP
jgi:hypothetical protein